MRVLVCGGRDYGDKAKLYASLDALDNEVGIDMIVHGGATGADSLAGDWAYLNEVPCVPYPTEPYVGGLARNSRMLALSGPDLVLHFPGANGTKDMVRRAQEANVRTHGGLAGPLNPVSCQHCDDDGVEEIDGTYMECVYCRPEVKLL